MDRRVERKKFSCQFCEKSFLQKRNLLAHEMRHKGLTPFYCKTCRHYFVEKDKFDKHMSKHETRKISSIDEKLIKKEPLHLGKSSDKENNPVLHKIASSSIKQQQHIEMYSDEKPYSCKICEKRFKSKLGYDIHMSSHGEGEFKFACKYCQRSYPNQMTLNKPNDQMHVYFAGSSAVCSI